MSVSCKTLFLTVSGVSVMIANDFFQQSKPYSKNMDWLTFKVNSGQKIDGRHKFATTARAACLFQIYL